MLGFQPAWYDVSRMKNLRNLLVLLAAIGVSAAGAARAEGEKDELIKKLDDLQPTRDQPGVEKEIDALVSQALKAAPDDYEVLWRAARHHCWVAEGLPEAQKTRKQVEAKQCWDLGAKAAKLQPEKVQGNYFAANGAGTYSETIGILKALSQGIEGTFNGYLDKAISLDRGFKGAAPLLAKGRYYFRLPWPKRSYSKSEDMFKQAIAIDPKAVRAKLWLAETLVNDGKAKEAKTYLDQCEAQIASGDEGFDPPEVRRVQSWVGPVKQKIQEELK